MSLPKWHLWPLYMMLLCTSFSGLTLPPQPIPKPTTATIKGASKPTAKAAPRANKEGTQVSHGSDNPGDDSDTDMPALATAYDSDDEDVDEDKVMEEWEESAEEELSKCSYYIQTMVDLHDIRAPHEGLELTYLCCSG